MAERREPSLRVFILVWLVSLLLLAVTALAGPLNVGPYRVILGLGVAVAMTLLQMLFYMRLWYRHGLIRLFAASGFYWLVLMFGLTLSDYLTRVPVPPPW
jgi:cytochrome c oxidase subunit 4